jgi:hypothetical protein
MAGPDFTSAVVWTSILAFPLPFPLKFWRNFGPTTYDDLSVLLQVSVNLQVVPWDSWTGSHIPVPEQCKFYQDMLTLFLSDAERATGG